MSSVPPNKGRRIKLLESEFRTHESNPFPKPSDDPEVIELHGELTAYDAAISGYISRILGGERFRLSVIGPDRGIERRTEKLLREKPDQSATVRQYQRYYSHLQELIALANAIVRERA